MKFNAQMVIYISVLVTLCFFCCFSSAASLENLHLKSKRSPYLRLDELSTKIYLAKNKLGGGLVDPLEIGKRSSSNSQQDSEVQLAVTLYDGLVECLSHETCSHSLKLILDN